MDKDKTNIKNEVKKVIKSIDTIFNCNNEISKEGLKQIYDHFDALNCREKTIDIRKHLLNIYKNENEELSKLVNDIILIDQSESPYGCFKCCECIVVVENSLEFMKRRLYDGHVLHKVELYYRNQNENENEMEWIKMMFHEDYERGASMIDTKSLNSIFSILELKEISEDKLHEFLSDLFDDM